MSPHTWCREQLTNPKASWHLSTADNQPTDFQRLTTHPVSYTHLDVYKRQVIDSVICVVCARGLSRYLGDVTLTWVFACRYLSVTSDYGIFRSRC